MHSKYSRGRQRISSPTAGGANVANSGSVLERASDVTHDGFATPVSGERTVVPFSTSDITSEGFRHESFRLVLLFAATDAALGSHSFFPHVNDTDRLRAVQRLTGLDWGTIARTLGVTRRAVHHWLAGGSLSPENARRVRTLETLMRRNRWRSETPVQFNHRLTDLDGSGRTLLSRIRQEVLDGAAHVRAAPSPIALLNEDSAHGAEPSDGLEVDESFNSTSF